MTIKVTVNVISAEQFGINSNVQPEDDKQRVLLPVPSAEPTANVLVPASGAIEVTASEESVPLSYGVSQLTGGW